jgi:WD40 repeat protein
MRSSLTLHLSLPSLSLCLPSPSPRVQHDAQLDYYGKRLATCSSDRSIRIFDVSATHAQTLTSQIRGHEGPVWQVGWAHPKYGSILASCSYDSRVCVWKEQAANAWIKVYEYSRPDSSINTLQWAPHSFGLVLAVGAADGTVSVLARKQDHTWDVSTFLAHKGGVNSVSWGPDGQERANGQTKREATPAPAAAAAAAAWHALALASHSSSLLPYPLSSPQSNPALFSTSPPAPQAER